MRPVIYIQADKHSLIRHQTVRAKDLCKIYCRDKALAQAAGEVVVCRLGASDDRSKKTASALWLISCMDQALSGICDFENIGEAEFVFSADMDTKRKKGRLLKIILVAAVTFAGSVFAIMTYNEDVSSMDVFAKISDFFGAGKKGVKMLAAGYAVGIAAGIVVFFNHFGKRRLTKEPTPMEVEMEKYEADIEDTLIKKNSREGKMPDGC